MKAPILKNLRHLTIQARLPSGRHFPLDVELLRAAPALRCLNLSGIGLFQAHRGPEGLWTWPSLQTVSFHACLQEGVILDRVVSQQHDVELDDLPRLRRIRRFLLRDKLVFDLEVLTVRSPPSTRTRCLVDSKLVRRAHYRSIRQVHIDPMMVALASTPPHWLRLQECFEHADYFDEVLVGRKIITGKIKG